MFRISQNSVMQSCHTVYLDGSWLLRIFFNFTTGARAVCSLPLMSGHVVLMYPRCATHTNSRTHIHTCTHTCITLLHMHMCVCSLPLISVHVVLMSFRCVTHARTRTHAHAHAHMHMCHSLPHTQTCVLITTDLWARGHTVSQVQDTHTHAHTYARTHTHTQTHTFVHIHVHKCLSGVRHTHTHAHTCIHTHANPSTHARTYTNIHIHIHIHTHTHTHTHTHIHKHTHTHTHTYVSLVINYDLPKGPTLMHMQTYTRKRKHTHTHMHQYTHTCIHTHTHTITHTPTHTGVAGDQLWSTQQPRALHSQSHVTQEWVMSHMNNSGRPWMCHVTHKGAISHMFCLCWTVNCSKHASSAFTESFHTEMRHVAHEWVTSRLIELCQMRMSHVAQVSLVIMYDLPNIREFYIHWVISQMNELYHIWTSHVTHEWVMPHMIESWHTWMSHVAQVSLVINYDLPNNRELYIHRIGRSGRYGRKGLSRTQWVCHELNESITNLMSLSRTQYDISFNQIPQT